MFRLLVCGDRNWRDPEAIQYVLGQVLDTYGEFILWNGGCPYKGADEHAHNAAIALEQISITVPAKFKTLGKPAGPKRNIYMLEKGRPELVLAFHSDINKSKGTKHMLKIAREAGVQCALFDGSNFNLEEVLKNAKE